MIKKQNTVTNISYLNEPLQYMCLYNVVLEMYLKCIMLGCTEVFLKVLIYKKDFKNIRVNIIWVEKIQSNLGPRKLRAQKISGTKNL